MLRRSFLRLLAALPALPFVGRAKAATGYEYRIVPLAGSRDAKPLTDDAEAMRSHFAGADLSKGFYHAGNGLMVSRQSMVSWRDDRGQWHMKYIDHNAPDA